MGVGDGGAEAAAIWGPVHFDKVAADAADDHALKLLAHVQVNGLAGVPTYFPVFMMVASKTEVFRGTEQGGTSRHMGSHLCMVST